MAKQFVLLIANFYLALARLVPTCLYGSWPLVQYNSLNIRLLLHVRALRILSPVQTGFKVSASPLTPKYSELCSLSSNFYIG